MTPAHDMQSTAVLANQNVAALANMVRMPRTSIQTASAAAMGTLAAHAALQNHAIQSR